MTPDPALDAVIRQARHLLFAFDGPIRHVASGKSADSTTTTTPHIHEALRACRESGRSASVIGVNQSADVRAYLDVHDLSTQFTVVTVPISEALTALRASPGDCALITSSPAEIKIAQAIGALSIGYARTRDDATRLVDVEATSLVYSLAELCLSLRAHPLPN
jgi:beta-phosphoglucomutase-like phosphatase (HAD superfamily)